MADFSFLAFSFTKMEARIDRIEQEIAALEERQLSLTANLNRTPLEEAELSLLPSKLARLETRYNNIVQHLTNTTAPTRGTFN